MEPSAYVETIGKDVVWQVGHLVADRETWPKFLDYASGAEKRGGPWLVNGASSSLYGWIRDRDGSGYYRRGKVEGLIYHRLKTFARHGLQLQLTRGHISLKPGIGYHGVKRGSQDCEPVAGNVWRRNEGPTDFGDARE
jgi:hypothetical protein